jgi:hypothetical protein
MAKRASFVWVVSGIALLGCGGSRVLTKEEVAAQKKEKALAAARAEAESTRTADAGWKGSTVGLEEPFELVGTQEVKLDQHDWRVALIKTTWSEMETPKGKLRTGTARLLVTRGEEMKNISIDEGKSLVALGFRIEVQLATEKYDAKRAEYDPHVKLVVHRE